MIEIVFIVILILIIIYIHLNQCCIFDKLVSGFYSSDPSFLIESGLDSFCIYINDDIKNGERACYILAKKDSDIVINEPSIVKLTLSSTVCDVNVKYFNAEFKGLSDECSEIFASSQKLQFYPQTGKIILHDGDTVTFAGYKDGIHTEMKKSVDPKQYDSE